MKSHILPQQVFIQNRFKLAGLTQSNSCLILFSADEMPRNGDQYFPYRQSSDFFYLTGIEQERSALVLCPGHPNKEFREILFIIESTPEMETWNGKKLRAEEAREISGIQNVQFESIFESLVADVLKESETVYLNKPELPKFFPDVMSRDEREGKKLREKYPYHSYKRIAPILRDLRVIKASEEIKCIERAVAITGNAFKTLLQAITPGMTEKDIEARLIYEFIRNGSSGHAFHPVVASGENACFLHYNDNDDVLDDGELLLMDFGAEFSNYASDCSRTFPVNGRFTDRQAELYDGLLEVFYRAREIMKPGIRMEEVHQNVINWMKDFHVSANLYSKDELEKSQSSPLWFRYYMHGTGHSVGLDVHDTYDKTAELKPGMVFTCEPGIYIREEKIGIRIENDILITENGNRDLMDDIPIERKELENIMNSR